MNRIGAQRRRLLCGSFILCLLAAAPNCAQAGEFKPAYSPQSKPASAAPDTSSTLNLDAGTLDFHTPDFTLKLVRSSQTVAALQPVGADGFDFTPADRLATRARNGYHHLGDLTFRVRSGRSGDWRDYDTALSRQPVRTLSASSIVLASADLSPTLPADCPLRVTRSWMLDGGRLALRFELRNTTDLPVQIGALGIPMIFNNILIDRTLNQAHEICSFADPYIGQDAGYLQVTRLNGHGPALVVVPDGKNTPFEAYQLLNEPTRPNQTFEGAFAWMVHTQAYAENEWKKAAPWNPPTAFTLAPGESHTIGVRFLVSDTIRHIEKTLADNKRPVAVGIPGYVLPTDLDAKLFLNYGHKVSSMDVEPKGAIAIHAEKPTPGGWQAWTLRGKMWGRARVSVMYADGLHQSISCYVIKPAAQAVADLGHFLTTRQWFVDSQDPFHRSPSVLSYDREADKLVTQDSRVWIAGLGDEGGSGSWLAAAMKEFGQPNREELARYEQFVDKVLWGGIQFKDGPNKYAVRKSMFYYAPQELPNYPYDLAKNWQSWTSWSKPASEDIGRGFNYPHVVAAYWAMYQVARNAPDMVTLHDWRWYLDQAFQTTKFMFSRDMNGNRRVGYVELGLMEGDIFLTLLKDLQHEGWKAQAGEVESLMKERAERWSHEEYPFGSEMAWDSTGQEEVYAWCKYFGYEDKAQVSLNSVLGYMPTLPHWGYNGSARRYWDFLYGGKLSRIERQLHHYGSGINAIPVLAEYRQHPDDVYLLRVGYGGLMGALTNIDREGFASVAFHSFPSTLQWDAYTGDYGPNFFGHAINTATYIVKHPEFGWQAFGGNVKEDGEWVRVQTRDSLRKRVYVASRSLWLALDAGAFEGVDVNTRTAEVRVGLAGATAYGSMARLRVEQQGPKTDFGPFHPVTPLKSERDAYVVPLGRGTTWIKLTAPVGHYSTAASVR